MTQLAQMVALLQRRGDPDGFPSWLSYQTKDINKLFAIASQSGAPPDLLADVLVAANRAHGQITKLMPDPVNDCLVFADPQPTNTVIYQGRRLFIDFDEVSRGPYEINLAIIKASDWRSGSNDYPTFARILGESPNHELVKALAKLRAAAGAVWTAALWRVSAEKRASAIEQTTALNQLTCPETK